jgi:hypothetical protein
MANGMEVDLACVGVRKINQALHKGRSGCTGFEGTGRGAFHAIPDLRAAKRADRRLHDSIRRVGDIAPQLTLGAKQALNLLEQSGLPNKLQRIASVRILPRHLIGRNLDAGRLANESSVHTGQWVGFCPGRAV